MTDVNTLNAETRLKKQFSETNDRLSALLIAVYKLPLEQRTPLLELYNSELERIKADRIEDQLQADAKPCEVCDGDGVIEIMGEGSNFEWDVVGHKPCPECFPPRDEE
jgi:hypothetical protein